MEPAGEEDLNDAAFRALSLWMAQPFRPRRPGPARPGRRRGLPPASEGQPDFPGPSGTAAAAADAGRG